MLTKDLLRVSRAGGAFTPRFAGREERPLAAKVLGTYQGHVGETRADLWEALTDLEREATDFKLVRGFAKLLERESVFETRADVPPERARAAAFEAAEAVGVVSEEERETALSRAADHLRTTPDALETALYADLEERGVLAEVDSRWGPDDLLAQYNLSLAQTALFDATEVRIRCSDPRAAVSAIKRLKLMYEIVKVDGEREIVITGPDSLFRATRRYGTRFARLLRTLAKMPEWRLVATVDDYGTEREMALSDADPVRVPDAEPVAEVAYDSGVESDFAARFAALDLDWELVREPEALSTGARVMIPDFAFEYRHGRYRVYFEIMGFWTPEYVEKKLDQLENVEDVELLVAVDESLGVGAEVEARDHRAIPYRSTVRVKDVRDALRRYEADLVAENAATLPEELVPEADVITLAALAADHGVSEAALADKSFPDHDLVGRTLIRPDVLADLRGEIEAGDDLAEVRAALEPHGITDESAVLSTLGYRVAWEGLGGGTVVEKE